MSKERETLDNSATTLLIVTAGDLIPMLRNAPDLIHVRQSAFDYYDKENDEHWQVQITVTRKESDFLEFLQTEEMSEYKKG